MSEQPTTEKLHTLALAAARLLPDEWALTCVPSKPGMPSDDPSHWHEFYSGTNTFGRPTVLVPCPDTPSALFIYLHEIGHVIFGHVYMGEERAEILEQVETMASLWAYTYMRANGLEVPLVAKSVALAMARLQGQSRFMPKALKL